MQQTAPRLSGVIAPVATPFDEEGLPDADRFIEHCEWLIEEGCTALAPFGTTSEGTSLGLDERMELLEELIEAGVPPVQLMPGTGTASLADTIELTAHAVEMGCAGVLVLPPFFYKAPSEEGLYRYYCELIEELGDHRLALYLYHIPQMSGVAVTHGLIDRLVSAYPGTIAGLKDSSGDLAGTRAYLQAFPGLAIFPASESALVETMAQGAAGCISATANLQARAIRTLYDTLAGGGDGALHAPQVMAVREALMRHPIIPAVKALIAEARADPQWRLVRPPLVAFDEGEQARLAAMLKSEVGFALSIASAV